MIIATFMLQIDLRVVPDALLKEENFVCARMMAKESSLIFHIRQDPQSLQTAAEHSCHKIQILLMRF